MSNFVFNTSKGRVAHYASLPGANDAIIIIPIETAGIEADETLKDHDTLASLLAGTSNEQVTMGRKTMAGVVVNVDDINNRVDSDATDPEWPLATGNAISAFVICYVPDVGVSTDADIRPLTKHDYTATPNGSNISAVIAVTGWYRAKEPAVV